MHTKSCESQLRALLNSATDEPVTYSSGRSHSSVCSFMGATLRSKRSKDTRGAGPGAAATAYDDDSLVWDGVRRVASTEARRLKRIPPQNAEHGVVRNYVRV
jgi:hypothetical protein